MANANIFQQYLQAPRSVLDYQAQYDEADARKADLETRKQQNALQALTMDQTRGQMADASAKRNAIQSIYAANPTADPLTRARALQNNPLTAAEGVAAEKALLENDKTRAATNKETAEASKIKSGVIDSTLTRFRGALDYIDTPQGAVRWLQAQYQDPAVGEHMQTLGPLEQAVANIPQDPQGFQQWRQRAAVGMEKYIDQVRQQGVADETKRNNIQTDQTSRRNNDNTNATSRANNSATVGATIRGQNLTDARSRETLSQGKVPVGYRANPDGSMSFIPGGPADPSREGGKPLTEGQAKDLAFGSRMRASNQIIDQLAEKGTTTNISGMDAGMGVGRVITALSTDKQQQLNQAKRDWINANLRRESGAVIGKDEFDSADRQYFPQIGDGEKTREQKRQNRMLAEQGVLAGAPGARRDELVKPGGASAPTGSGALSKEEQAELAALKKRFGK